MIRVILSAHSPFIFMQSHHARKVLLTVMPPCPFVRQNLQMRCLGVRSVYKSPFDDRTQIGQLANRTRQFRTGIRLRLYNNIPSTLLPTPRFYCTRSAQMTGNSADTLQNQYRLPVDVKATHYDVTIRTDLEKTEYQGFVRISLDIKKDTSRIVLNSSELKLASAYVLPVVHRMLAHLDHEHTVRFIRMRWRRHRSYPSSRSTQFKSASRTTFPPLFPLAPRLS